MASPKRTVPRVLLAMDCDRTIIDGNSDTWIMSHLLPDRSVPFDIKMRFKTEHNNWTIYMNEIFEFLHSLNIDEADFHDSVAGIPLTPGMKELFNYQASYQELDCIVLSFSNSYFIDVILGSRNFLPGVSKIYTNQAEFNPEGCLKIHISNPHNHTNCPRQCPENLCKQASLQAFLEEQKAKGVEYDRVCMIGDGRNDLCPCFCLKERDYIFPRKGYPLDTLLDLEQNFLLEERENDDECIKATVVAWESATEILDVLKKLF